MNVRSSGRIGLLGPHRPRTGQPVRRPSPPVGPRRACCLPRGSLAHRPDVRMPFRDGGTVARGSVPDSGPPALQTADRRGQQTPSGFRGRHPALLIHPVDQNARLFQVSGSSPLGAEHRTRSFQPTHVQKTCLVSEAPAGRSRKRPFSRHAPHHPAAHGLQPLHIGDSRWHRSRQRPLPGRTYHSTISVSTDASPRGPPGSGRSKDELAHGRVARRVGNVAFRRRRRPPGT